VKHLFRLSILTIALAALITFGPVGCAKPLTPEQRAAALQQNAETTEAATRAQAEAEEKLAAATAAGKLDEVKALKIELGVYKHALELAKADKAALENPSATGGYNWLSFLSSIVTSPSVAGSPASGAVTIASLLFGFFQRRKAITAANEAAAQTEISHAIVNSVEAASPSLLTTPETKNRLARVEGAAEFVEAAKSN